MRYDALAPEYASLWDGMVIGDRLRTAIDRMAARVLSGKERYRTIEAQTRVPWYVVGVIHAMESGCKFDCHLHNGDPLSAKTKLVPRGRPLGGSAPFTWEQSACDALLMKGYDKLPDWTVERICWALERYNGWGYRRFHKDVLSPYLWSGSNHYTRGKYVADGKWSATAISAQPGAMPLLKRMSELDTSIVLKSAFAADCSAPDETTPASFRSTDPAGLTTGDKIKVGAAVITAVGGTTAATQSATPPALVVPPVPQGVSDNLSNAVGWQGVVGKMADIGSWAVSSPLVMLIVAAMVGLWFLPKLVRQS